MKVFELTKGELYYLIFLSIITVNKGLGLDASNIIYRGTFFVSLIFLGLKVLSEGWSKKLLLGSLLILVPITLNYYTTGKETLLLAFLILIGIRNVPLKRIFKTIFFIRLISFIVLFLATSIGLIENKYVVFWRNGEFIERYGFGFSNPNLLHSSFCIIVFLYIYLFNKSRYRNLIFILILLFNQCLYTWSYSRSGYVMTIIAVFGAILHKNRYVEYIFSKIVFQVKMVLFIGTILAGTIFYSTEFDELFTGRLKYVQLQLSEGLSLFGKSLPNVFYDNSYSMLLSLYGLVVTGMYIVFYYRTVKKIRYDKHIVLIFLITACYLFTESYLANPLYNISLFFIAKELLGELEGEIDDNNIYTNIQ